MDPETLEVIRRAHAMFGAAGSPPQLAGVDAGERNGTPPGGGSGGGYRQAAAENSAAVRGAVDRDGEVRSTLTRLMSEHQDSQQRSQSVLDAARADRSPAADTPMGAREAMARKAAYLRAQRETIMRTRAQSRRHAALLRKLRYGRGRRGRTIPPALLSRLKGRGGAALRAALTQLGVKYVFGGNAWGRGLDCSSLIQQAWARAGVRLPRTTWDLINVGMAVPRSQLMVGDMIFPTAGHVQMYAGGGKVIEAPYTGASVRIANLPSSILAIRRPV